jgi:hypothetical protein
MQDIHKPADMSKVSHAYMIRGLTEQKCDDMYLHIHMGLPAPAYCFDSKTFCDKKEKVYIRIVLFTYDSQFSDTCKISIEQAIKVVGDKKLSENFFTKFNVFHPENYEHFGIVDLT